MTSILSPLWRFLVTDLDGAGISILDHLASDRIVTPKLGEALEISGTVPSDNPAVNRVHTDGFPLLAEGVRQLYAFRLESDTVPYYTIRGSTLLLQMDDATRSDDARSRFTGWDPWRYLFSRPCLNADGTLIGPKGLTYANTATADVIALDILNTAILWADATAPAAAQACFLDITSGTIQTCGTFPDGWTIQQGTSVGQALQDLAASGYLDIVLAPIYDPVGRPGILCELNIYAQDADSLGAGTYNYGAIFAWDRPGTTVVGADNLYDGTGRANVIQYYNGQGGPPVARQIDAASVAIYGEYWAQEFFPAQTQKQAVVAIAAEQLALRSTFKETLTLHPAPERSPEPFVDYYLGDGVQVFISDNMRQELDGWTRVYGIPVEIDDNGVETVRELLVGPIGPPPPVGGAGTVAPLINNQVAVTTARAARAGTGRIGT